MRRGFVLHARRTAISLITLSITLSAVANGATGMTTVILVRHAEKVADETLKDPHLTADGQSRAKELARMLGNAGVTAIYTTPWERTRQTAAPLATALRVQPLEIKTGPTYANEVASIIRAKHAGSTVLIVGHSNTTGDVIRALGIAGAPEIPDAEYDNLFVVTLAEGSEPALLKLKF